MISTTKKSGTLNKNLSTKRNIYLYTYQSVIFSKFLSRKKVQITDRPVQNQIPANSSQNSKNISALGTLKVNDPWQHLTRTRISAGRGELHGKTFTTNLIQFVSVIFTPVRTATVNILFKLGM